MILEGSEVASHLIEELLLVNPAVQLPKGFVALVVSRSIPKSVRSQL